jgi:hypothetical protein
MTDIQTCPITLYTRAEIENAGRKVLNVNRGGKLVQIYDVDEIAKWLSHHTLYPHLDKPTPDEISIIQTHCKSFVLFVPPINEEMIYYEIITHSHRAVNNFKDIQIVNSRVNRNLLLDLKQYFSTYFKAENFKNANIYLIGHNNRPLTEPRRKCFGIFKGISLYQKIKTINLVRIYITIEDEICCNFKVETTKNTVNALKVSFFSNDFTSRTSDNMVRNDDYWATYEYFDTVSNMSNNIPPYGSKIVYYNETGETFFNKKGNSIEDFSSVAQGGSSMKKLHNQSIVLAGIKNENLIQDIVRLGGVVRTKPSGKTTLVVIPRRDYKSAAVTFAKTKNIKIITIGVFCKKMIPDT